jgi:hypothetical protein
MSKAEDRALEIYPPKLVTYSDLFGEETLDNNGLKRTIFIEGYLQAEKDLELTWEDIKIILDIENDILRECNSQKELVIETYPKGEDYYGEILKRFKERK